MKRKILILIQILAGCLFIFSGVAKLTPIETFEQILVRQGLASWESVVYLSRFIIIIELFLGLSFFQSSYIKKIFTPAAIGLLIIFSIHLTYTIITEGSKGNCGCFGQLIVMTPLEALIKNIILLIPLVYLYFNIETPGVNLTPAKRESFKLPAAYLVISLLAVMLLFPIKHYELPDAVQETTQVERDSLIEVQTDDKSDEPAADLKTDIITEQKPSNETEIEAKPKLEKKVSVFAGFKEFSGETVDLDSGEKIVALFSLDCEDCMETALKIGELMRANNLPAVYVLFLGEQEQVADFFEAAQTEFKYQIIPPQKFFPLIGNFPPRIVYLKEGNILGDWDYDTFDEHAFIEKIKQSR
jgi:hypothetical protein